MLRDARLDLACFLEGRPAHGPVFLLDWRPLQDSNLRPSAPEADALSSELRGRRRS